MDFVFAVKFDYVCVGFLDYFNFPPNTLVEVDGDCREIRVFIGDV